VRLQLALTLGEMDTPQADVARRDLVVRAGRQPLLADAVVSGLAGRENDLVEALVHSPAAAAQSGEVLRYATSAILKSGEAARIERVLGIVGAAVTPEWARIPMLSGVRHFLPKGPDGSSYPALLPAEPKPLVALAADPASPAALIVQPLLAQLRWPGKPGVPATVAVPLTKREQRRYDQGREKFAVLCAACHQGEGQGLGGIAPPLVHSSRVLGDPRILARIVLNGKTQENLVMPPWKEVLDDESLAGILTFIRRSWGHEAGPVAPDVVREARAATADRHEPFSEADLLELAESLGR
jgi:mono/diheme cytochrome c family protein